jgi:hypothetical protein
LAKDQHYEKMILYGDVNEDHREEILKDRNWDRKS